MTKKMLLCGTNQPVDFFNCDRHLRRDIVWEVIWSVINVIFIRFLVKTNLGSFVFCQLLGVPCNALELVWSASIKCSDNIAREFCRGIGRS
jgi:hypothetical protein